MRTDPQLPAVLRAAATQVDREAAALTELAARLRLAVMAEAFRWRGPMASTYTRVLLREVKALTTAASQARELSRTLRNAAGRAVARLEAEAEVRRRQLVEAARLKAQQDAARRAAQDR